MSINQGGNTYLNRTIRYADPVENTGTPEQPIVGLTGAFTTAAAAATSGLAAHLADTGDAHDASAISYVAGGTVAATDVQAAIAEVATDYAAADSAHAALTAAHGLATDTGWQAASFAANWSDFDASNAACLYKKDALGMVCIEGLVKKGTALSLPDTIFTLPAGYRPATQKLFAGTGSGGVFAEIGITTAGLVRLRAGGSATYTSLTGIRFDPNT